MGSLMDIAIEAVNLHYRKQYNEAIKLLDSYFAYLTKKEDLAQFHTDYALNYEKLKDIEKCNYHREEAVRLFHCGSYSYERLIKNYVKAKDWKNALRICDTVLKRKNVFKHKPTWEVIRSYALKRKEFILKQIQKEL